jgi:hypothetical protein
MAKLLERLTDVEDELPAPLTSEERAEYPLIGRNPFFFMASNILTSVKNS